MTRTTREDVVTAAGRLFAADGYDGTSMRDLGREVGLLGSSLYAHVEGKQELLVEIVMRGSVLFEDSAAMLGLVVAFFGILLSEITGDPRFDGAASIVIGLILAGFLSLMMT